jgi:two-component system, cell cycle response regulator DivK
VSNKTGETVLVIEDNEDNMVLITMLLENAGYETLWADCGLKGVQYTLKYNPDLILLDIQLPDFDGTEVLKRIRAMKEDISMVPIIAMTSYAMAGDREKLLEAGCNGYIEKPINPMTVIEQIQNITGVLK